MSDNHSSAAGELLPVLKCCPFCGGSAHTNAEDGRFYVACDDLECLVCLGEGYDAYGEPAHAFMTEEQAIAAWNTRTPSTPSPEAGASFQDRVQPWMMACFGPEIAADVTERCDRFIEEAFELVQSLGWTPDRARALIDYTWSRPAGEPKQEVGGVMVTLAALCLAKDYDMHHAGETELARIWTKVEQIRAKQAAKPTGSALPVPQSPEAGEDALREAAFAAVGALAWASGRLEVTSGTAPKHVEDALTGLRAALTTTGEGKQP
jgi:hypothetical protein